MLPLLCDIEARLLYTVCRPTIRIEHGVSMVKVDEIDLVAI